MIWKKREGRLLQLADMDEEERREALEDAGLDPDDYEDEF